MVRQILDWQKEKAEALIDDPNEVNATSMAKAFGLGIIEGAVDGFFVVGLISWGVTVCNVLFKKE